jgi:outer membrane protein assembly factor BamE (lipoprotein component of BamABCDE complex)
MIHDTRHNIFIGVASALVTMVALVLLGSGSAATTGAQTPRTNAHGSATTQQPLYSEYRGVRIGMDAQEVRTKLGAPLQKADDMDFYVFSEAETAQIAYDASHKVKVVSVDYVGGAGAPDYKLVVGPDVAVKEDGAIYKLMRYESLGFWVSYNRSGNTVPIVTITITKM